MSEDLELDLEILEDINCNDVKILPEMSNASETFLVPTFTNSFEISRPAERIHKNLFDPDRNVVPIRDFEAKPFCQLCETCFFTWPGYEYHMLSEHVGYCPFRCFLCPRDNFHTEAEGRHHIALHHPTRKNIALYKCIDIDKEKEIQDLMTSADQIPRRFDLSITYQIASIAEESATHLRKFSRMRYAIPTALKRFSAEATNVETNTQGGPNENPPPGFPVSRQNFHNCTFEYVTENGREAEVSTTND